MKRFFAMLMALVMMLSLCACGAAADKVFTCGDLSITLTTGFKESSVEGQDAFYESRSVGVTVVEDAKANIAGGDTMTKKEYGELVIELSERESLLGVTELDDLTYFSYVSAVDSDSYTYEAYIYESADAFWLVQFFCLTDNYSKHIDSFRNWARTVTVSGASDTDAADDATTEPTTEATTEATVAEKAFVCGDMTLTLTEDFEENSTEGADGFYLSDNVGVVVLMQSRAELSNLGHDGANMTAKQYAELIIDSNGQTTEGVKEEDGLTYYVFTTPSGNYNFTYQCFAFASEDNLYLVQFYCLNADFEALSPSFAQWAKAITIA